MSSLGAWLVVQHYTRVNLASQFYAAVAARDHERAQALRAHGADPNLRDRNGFTLLHWAGYEGDASTVAFLLRHGADVGARSYQRDTPLHFAAAAGRTRCVEMLITAGAPLNAVKAGGSTALLLAARNGHAEVVRSLCASGAAVDLGNSGGKTPLHFAAQGCHLEVARVLLEFGADPGRVAKDGTSPVSEARIRGCRDLQALFLKGPAATQRSKTRGAALRRRSAVGSARRMTRSRAENKRGN